MMKFNNKDAIACIKAAREQMQEAQEMIDNAHRYFCEDNPGKQLCRICLKTMKCSLTGVCMKCFADQLIEYMESKK
jgi:5-methylcytosine-specific restriction endonuclease McrBC regulatory subunit McrC